jgi:hypothetical protein
MKRIIRLCWLVAVLAVDARHVAAADADPLDAVEKSSTEWLQTRLEASRLEAAWASERTLLESTLAAMTERASAEEEKRDLARAKAAKDRDEIATLRDRARASQEDLSALENRLKEAGGRLTALRPALPPRLSAALELAYRSLERPNLSPAERMQLTITVLNRCIQFNRVITAGEEQIQMPGDENPRVMQVMYWGLSHGYALDERTNQAWVGHATAGHWAWQPHPDAAPRIAHLLKIFNGKADPQFVIVPVAADAQAPAH